MVAEEDGHSQLPVELDRQCHLKLLPDDLMKIANPPFGLEHTEPKRVSGTARQWRISNPFGTGFLELTCNADH